MARELLDTIVPTDWDSQKPAVNSGFQRTRWLQGVSDLVKRPVSNRAAATTSATAVNATGSPVSTGIGTIAPRPGILSKGGTDGKTRSLANIEVPRLRDLRTDRDRSGAASLAAPAVRTDRPFRCRAAPWETIGVSNDVTRKAAHDRPAAHSAQSIFR